MRPAVAGSRRPGHRVQRKARFAKVEVDEAGEMLAAFDATRLPTYLVLVDGVEVDRFDPLVFDWNTTDSLRKMVEKTLAASGRD